MCSGRSYPTKNSPQYVLHKVVNLFLPTSRVYVNVLIMSVRSTSSRRKSRFGNPKNKWRRSRRSAGLGIRYDDLQGTVATRTELLCSRVSGALSGLQSTTDAPLALESAGVTKCQPGSRSMSLATQDPSCFRPRYITVAGVQVT